MSRLAPVVIMLFSTLATSLWAKPATPSDARLAVVGWLASDSDPLGVRLGQTVNRVETFPDATGDPAYYVVYLEPQGFVIVSADDLVEPIIGFSPSGTYDPSPANPLGALVTGDLNSRMAAVRVKRPTSSADDKQRVQNTRSQTAAQQKWAHLTDLASGKKPSVGTKAIDKTDDIEDLRVWPLLYLDPDKSSTWIDWGQSGCDVYRFDTSSNQWADYVESRACFNYHTPPADPLIPSSLGNPDNYPAGCAAIAVAQLMRYHMWPQREPNWIDPVTGMQKSFSIRVTTDGNTVERLTRLLGGSGTNGAYLWESMPAQPVYYGLQDVHRREIGALCYDAGITLGMSYSATQSSAWVEDAKDPLLNVFRYTNAVIGQSGELGLLAGLNNMINPNLDASNPVLLGVRPTEGSGGHALVCDGYGYYHATLYHHLNMGWNEAVLGVDAAGAPLMWGNYTTDDVWYDLPNIDDMDRVSTDFDRIRVCLYNVFPEDSGEIISGRVVNSVGEPVPGKTVYLKYNNTLVDTAQTNANGIYAFVGCASDTLYTVSVPSLGYPSQEVQTGKSKDFSPVSGNRWGIDFPAVVSVGEIVYVDVSATMGANTGSSWANAFTDLQDALETAAGSGGTVQEIWVAEGTYTPDQGSGLRSLSFQLLDDVGIYGGFAGSETQRDQRNPENHPTVLSGDIAGDDGDNWTNNDENAYHVVNGSAVGPTAILDGFTITAGNASGNDPSSSYIDIHELGAGIYVELGDPTIEGCIILNNKATWGGGAYVWGGWLDFIACDFEGNDALYRGGAIYISGSDVGLSQCRLVNNTSNYGGAIYNENAAMTATSCVLADNYAVTVSGYAGRAGAIYNDSRYGPCKVVLSNCTLAGHWASDYPAYLSGIVCNAYPNTEFGSDLTLSNCIMWDQNNHVYTWDTVHPSTVSVNFSCIEGGSSYFRVGSDTASALAWASNNTTLYPMFRDATAGDYRLTAGSPCVDAGDPDYVAADGETDLDGNSRVIDGDGDGTATVDMGAYEFQR